ncbi:MAG: aspartate dehydrogenase [Phyllobacteriaceae bacterium]|jgi:aspartate dehydrogenase|nr:aspartate dehydrogenase [Phyllobacteriaceae bacterium]
MRLGVIGFGNIARSLMALLAEGPAPLAHLAVLCKPEQRDALQNRLDTDLADAAQSHAIVTDTAGLLAERCDLIVECAGHSAVRAHGPALLEAGLDVVVVSVGALADQTLEDTLRAAARKGGGRLIVPPGAVGGVDMLAALGTAGAVDVRYRGTKRPAAWRGTPAEKAVDLDTLDGPSVFFSGTAREAAAHYPKNANVAATLALAGAGFEKTQVELVADPETPGNVHQFEAVSPLARISVRIENQVSGGNARTSAATIHSVLREVRNRQAAVVL